MINDGFIWRNTGFFDSDFVRELRREREKYSGHMSQRKRLAVARLRELADGSINPGSKASKASRVQRVRELSGIFS